MENKMKNLFSKTINLQTPEIVNQDPKLRAYYGIWTAMQHECHVRRAFTFLEVSCSLEVGLQIKISRSADMQKFFLPASLGTIYISLGP